MFPQRHGVRHTVVLKPHAATRRRAAACSSRCGYSARFARGAACEWNGRACAASLSSARNAAFVALLTAPRPDPQWRTFTRRPTLAVVLRVFGVCNRRGARGARRGQRRLFWGQSLLLSPAAAARAAVRLSVGGRSGNAAHSPRSARVKHHRFAQRATGPCESAQPLCRPNLNRLGARATSATLPACPSGGTCQCLALACLSGVRAVSALHCRFQVPLAALEVESTFTTASGTYKCPLSCHLRGSKWVQLYLYF